MCRNQCPRGLVARVAGSVSLTEFQTIAPYSAARCYFQADHDGLSGAMNALNIDTLKLSRKLTAAGLEPAAAEAIAEVIRDVDTDDLVTRQDLQTTEQALKQDIMAVRSDLQQEISELRNGLHQEIAAVRADMRDMENRLFIKMGGMIVGSLAILTALMRIMPPG